MTQPLIKIPGPDHPITIIRNPQRVVVRVAGQVIADTLRALTLREAGYPPVEYIPRTDVDVSLLKLNETKTYCPYKGEASYFDVNTGSVSVADAVWFYEQPYDSVAAIKDHVAFYSDRVDVIEEQPSRKPQ